MLYSYIAILATVAACVLAIAIIYSECFLFWLLGLLCRRAAGGSWGGADRQPAQLRAEGTRAHAVSDN